jgi:hypothetical protein
MVYDPKRLWGHSQSVRLVRSYHTVLPFCRPTRLHAYRLHALNRLRVSAYVDRLGSESAPTSTPFSPPSSLRRGPEPANLTSSTPQHGFSSEFDASASRSPSPRAARPAGADAAAAQARCGCRLALNHRLFRTPSRLHVQNRGVKLGAIARIQISQIRTK